MRGLLYTLLVAAGLSTAAIAQAPAPGPFTQQFARALQRAMPSVSVKIVRDLQLGVSRPGGSAAVVNLANTYKDYLAEPGRFDEFIEAYAAVLNKSPHQQTAKLDRTRIVPVIKDRQWLLDLQIRFSKHEGSQRPVFDDINSELAIVYAEDTPKSTRYLSSSEDLGVARNALRALAVENVMRLMPRIELRQLDEGAFMMTSHADYGASLLLVESIWSVDQIKVDGEFIVAVPAKDVILITGSRGRDNVSKIRKLAHDLAKGRYGLTDTLFVYRRGQIAKFDPK